jgi:uncharacterized protein YyaL (SSP411 family)
MIPGKLPPVAVLALSLFLAMAPAIDVLGKTRPPLPTAEEIAALPPDGGPEFNRLIFEKSPYLLQHARNPVDWWPWGEAAFAEAKKQGKPVFLSIGYTTCHWCHVMEHESFEDPEVAALVNERFIAIKVDREERPDLDEVYMKVTEAMTGGGGWPMTVFLTPDKHAFFAGTYFPKESLAGRPGFKLLVTELHKAWMEKRDEVESTALGISAELGKIMNGSPGGALAPAILDAARTQYGERFDKEWGGFSMRPKFPVAPNLGFLLRHHRRSGDPESLAMVEKTLTAIRRGGIYDHVGHGIHRYSTDREWLVPHFEKMLYDQALYVIACLEAYQVTGKEEHARNARDVLEYVRRDMTSENGGFYSAEDADSEGEEGKFHTWTRAEVLEVLGPEDGAWFAGLFHLEEEGNYLDEATRKKNGTNIPHLRADLTDGERARFEPLRKKLWERRETRVHPQKDDKILTDWNGLMISAYAKAAQVLGDEAYAAAAEKAADFILAELTTEDGRLLKRHRQGEAGLTAHLEDYAFLIRGLLDLYETTFDVTRLGQAVAFQKILDERFRDTAGGGYFTVADDSEALIVRAKKLYGGAIPSGNAVTLGNLARLHRMTGDPVHAGRAEALIGAFSGEISPQPAAYPETLCALDFFFGPTREIVISGKQDDPGTRAMIAALRKGFRPNQVVLLRTPENAAALARIAPFTETQTSLEGKATAYVCRDFACQAPTTEVGEMMGYLDAE